ncbi:hypothetical protein HYS03_01405 [Candidatus Woesebacteria bacterium]|nr:hypothetical protein [Candidatus Woesebacteria bacterium]QQG47317.1 MAG: hypothetical protein HY044_04290 [Candidatus Woesebacteria bacterium]
MSKITNRFTVKQAYYPQTLPDKTEEFERLARETWVSEHRQDLEERRRREDAKNARIQASKEDKYLHAINLIIEHREAKDSPIYLGNGNDPTSFSIPYYFFNFEDHIKVRDLLEAFLFKLKNEGCFENFNRSPATPLGSSMIFHKINLSKLKEYRDRLIKEQKSNGNIQFQSGKRWTKRELGKELTRIKSIVRLGAKELNLLTILFDLNPHKIAELKGLGSREALKQLKHTVNIKIIKTTRWVIVHEGYGFNTASCYRLKFLTQPNNIR